MFALTRYVENMVLNSKEMAPGFLQDSISATLNTDYGSNAFKNTFMRCNG